jgi:hypothetical protein
MAHEKRVEETFTPVINRTSERLARSKHSRLQAPTHSSITNIYNKAFVEEDSMKSEKYSVNNKSGTEKLQNGNNNIKI